MSIEPRWAARYEFLRELWDGRDRLIVDDALVGVLAAPRRPAGPVGELVEALGGGRGHGRAWLLADSPRVLHGRRLRDLEVVDAAAAPTVADLPWEVALVDLDGFMGGGAAPSRMLRRDLPGVWRSLDRRAISLLDALAEAAAAGRGIVVTVSADRARSNEFQALIEHCFDRAHLFGVAPMPVIGVIDFGEVAREDDGRGGGAPDVTIAFDNTLAAEVPAFTAYVAVIGRRMSGGLTLVEVEGGGAEGSGEGGEGSEALRLQLAQARRQVEIGAAARHSLVEQLDGAQRRIEALEGRSVELEARLAEAQWSPPQPAPEAAGERVEVLRATAQTLRWELERARSQIDRLIQRPVDALEAEVAALREQVRGGVADAEGVLRARRGLERLARRIERGGASPVEIGAALAEAIAALGGEVPQRSTG